MTTTALILTLATAASLALAGDASAQRQRIEGPIEKAEMLERVRERFDRMDANADGYIGAGELGEGRRGRFGVMMLERQDANDDGFLSLEEMLTAAEARFDRLDTDGDGVLSEKERDAARGDRPRRGARRG
jgi:hypothetical protein